MTAMNGKGRGWRKGLKAWTKCIQCGKGFQAQPSWYRKYCSPECYDSHRRANSETAEGLSFRKSILRAGKHHESGLVFLYDKLVGAPYDEVVVAIDDYLRDHEIVRSQVKERFSSLSPGRRRKINRVILGLRKEWSWRHRKEGAPKKQ